MWYAETLRLSAADSASFARVYYSLRQSSGVHGFPSRLLVQPNFYRQLLDDLSGISLTPVGLMLLLAGFTTTDWRRHAAWLAGMAVLIVALPLKFLEMNYYQLVILPPLAVVAGLGWREIHRRFRLGRKAMAALLLLGLLFSVRYTIRPAFATPGEDRGVLAAAAALQRLAPTDASIVAMHGSTIDLLYYCERTGWAISCDDANLAVKLAECRQQGARYLVVCGPAEQIERVGQVENLAGRILLEATAEYRIYPLD